MTNGCGLGGSDGMDDTGSKLPGRCPHGRRGVRCWERLGAVCWDACPFPAMHWPCAALRSLWPAVSAIISESRLSRWLLSETTPVVVTLPGTVSDGMATRCRLVRPHLISRRPIQIYRLRIICLPSKHTHTSRIYLAHTAGKYLLGCASSWNLVRPSVVGYGCCNLDTPSGCAVPPSAPALAAGMQTDGGLGKHSVWPCRVSDAKNTAFRLETTCRSRCA
jgi:hypothetical protein